MKAYWMSVLALAVISVFAGGILYWTNPDAAQANLSSSSTRL